MNKVKVYRSGVPSAPAQRGCERESYEWADSLRPEGRQGRMDCLFASPSLQGVVKWVRANSFTNMPDVRVRELTVDADQVWVYSVHAWEGVGFLGGEASVHAYWKSGMSLTQWLATPDLNPREWEVLVGEAAVLSCRNVGVERVAGAARDDYEADLLRNMLKR